MLWPDSATGGAIRAVWEVMDALGVPSMATHTHRLHQPHVSLVVAEDLRPEGALEAVGTVPRRPIQLLINAAGVFPGGVLFLACVVNQDLLDEQRRVHRAVAPLAVDIWPYLEPGSWTPHITTGRELTPPQLAEALPLVVDALPIAGWLDHGGLEDGSTGENWPCPAPAFDLR